MRTAVLDRTRNFFGVPDGSVFAGASPPRRFWITLNALAALRDRQMYSQIALKPSVWAREGKS
jgi:hypothetical protein